MPKYNVPVQNAKYIPATSNPQLEAAFMSQETEIAKELLGPKAENLASAKHIFTRLEDGTFMEEALRTTENLVISIRSNSLFVKDQNGGLRQIGLENNNGAIDITVSEPVKEFEIPDACQIFLRQQGRQGAGQGIQRCERIQRRL